MTPYALLRRHRDYRLVLAAGLASLMGDWVLHIGLSYLVYDLTGSTLASGATLFAGFAPQMLLGSVAGVLVDRWDRRRTMVRCDLLQAVGLLPLLLVGHGRVWIVYAVALWQGCVEQFFTPASKALVPALVPPDDLLAANALSGQNQNVARLVGSSLGGVLAAWGGLVGIALFDAATFVVSASLVALVRVSARPDVAAPAAGRAVRRLVAEWRDGMALIRSSRALRTVLVFALVTSTGEGIMGTLFAPWVRDVVHGDGRAYGAIMAVQAVGGIAGGLVAASWGGRASPRALFGWGAVVFGVLDTVLFAYPVVWPHVAPAFVLMVVLGLPGAVAMAAGMTVVQTLAEDRYRGRVLGALGAVQGVAVVVGIGLASWLGEVVGILPVIVYQGVGYVIGGFVVLVGLGRTSPVASHQSHATSSASGGSASR
ncbi:MAG TPA: MFS transporter [Mycobacteriales bacterium]|jgi:MFS family permease|nr:MFS transporter [Mycobacteriales bacterium]